MYQGSCLCGSIQYEITGELGDFGYCHCTSCRKASGTAHAANSPIDRAKFRLVSGSETLREHESSPGKFRSFCSECGSPIFAYLTSSPDVLRIRLGSLDTPFGKQPRAHTFVGDKASWEPILDGLPQFKEWASRTVLDQKGSRQSARAGGASPVAVLDHASIPVADLDRAGTFYDAVLATIGLERRKEVRGGIGYGSAAGCAPVFWLLSPPDGNFATPGLGLHISFRAPDRRSVDAFFGTALRRGGRDAGGPAPRPDYSQPFYGAFVLDLDRFKIEAVCRTPEARSGPELD